MDVEGGQSTYLSIACSPVASLYMERLAAVTEAVGKDTQIGVAIIGDGSFGVREADEFNSGRQGVTLTWRHGSVVSDLSSSSYGEGDIGLSRLEALAEAIDAVLP